MNTSHARHNRKLRLLRRVASALTPMGLIGIAAAACQNPETPTAAQYAEYTCPQPIGVILRDDCARTSSKFDTLQSRGAVIAGTPEFRAAVLREVDATAVGLKAQAETQCNNFNTCRLPREDYMQAQGRLDSAFTELLNIRASISSLDAAGSVVVTQQIRDMRNAKSAAQVVTPARAAPDIAVQPVVATAPRAVTATSTPSTTASEWRPGKFMIQAVAGVADAANKLGTDSSWGYDVDGSAIMGAYLKTGASISMISNYEAGREYALLGQGSEGTIDLDMAIKT